MDIENSVSTYTMDKKKLEFCGEGEWMTEPDNVCFIYREYICKIRRLFVLEFNSEEKEVYFGGYLCGYVRIPSEHHLHHKKFEDMKIDCHFGLTFGEVSNGHWIGFDCAHLGDIVPSLEKWKENEPIIVQDIKKYKKDKKIKHTYKNIDFCKKQCKNIVDQLIKLEE